MGITSKTGDSGTTGLLFGKRVPKTSERILACGAIDELSAALGIARSQMRGFSQSGEMILSIQKHLIKLMTGIMVLPSDRELFRKSQFETVSQENIDWLEGLIHSLEPQVPTAQKWAIAGDTQPSAALHFARAVCRRAECCLWKVLEGDEVDGKTERHRDAVYLNRLSDLLWILAQQVKEHETECE
ncbi:MAG: cob(I)yrinic acid a,c-diamide adenosyltransferase [Limisphaerales bacterium]|jgi:cob(I)alamin adenosyltransferase|nr:cob(I)yrinic acid a,c-diamide adenosyltransferase [Verrucomicrobiota bacterium]